MTVVDESVTTYRCNEDKYLNFSSLQYPQEINATCSDNKIFQDKLPFWTIDQRILPLNEDSLCLGTTECSLPPSDISEMIHTWNGSKLVESSFQYSCHMNGERALTKFSTQNEYKTALTALKADIKYFPFRTEVKAVIIDMRIKATEKVYIYLSPSPKLENNTFFIQIFQEKVSINSFTYLYGNYERDLDTLKMADQTINQFKNMVKNVRIVVGASDKLYIGYWDSEDQLIYKDFVVGDLDRYFYIGFSSYSKASWEVSNGTNLKLRSDNSYSFVLVGPAASISGTRNEYISATCKQNALQGKLPGWVLETSIDEINGAKCKK